MEIKVIDNFANIEEQLIIIKSLENNDTYRFSHSSVDLIEFKTKLMIDYPHVIRPIFNPGAINTGCFIDPKLFSLTYYLLIVLLY